MVFEPNDDKAEADGDDLAQAAGDPNFWRQWENLIASSGGRSRRSGSGGFPAPRADSLAQVTADSSRDEPDAKELCRWVKMAVDAYSKWYSAENSRPWFFGKVPVQLKYRSWWHHHDDDQARTKMEFLFFTDEEANPTFFDLLHLITKTLDREPNETLSDHVFKTFLINELAYGQKFEKLLGRRSVRWSEVPGYVQYDSNNFPTISDVTGSRNRLKQSLRKRYCEVYSSAITQVLDASGPESVKAATAANAAEEEKRAGNGSPPGAS